MSFDRQEAIDLILEDLTRTFFERKLEHILKDAKDKLKDYSDKDISCLAESIKLKRSFFQWEIYS